MIVLAFAGSNSFASINKQGRFSTLKKLLNGLQKTSK